MDSQKISMKNLEHKPYTDPFASSCLEMIDILGIWYIVAGTNDKEIVIYNHGNRVWYYGGKQYKLSRAYRFWKLPRNKIMELDMYRIRYNRYSWFTRKSFYELIIYVSNNTTCIWQNDIKKCRIIDYKKENMNLTEKQKAMAGQAKMVSMDVLATIWKMMSDNTWEAVKVFNSYDADWIDLEKARLIWEWLKENFRKTQKKLWELAKVHDSYKKIIENY